MPGKKRVYHYNHSEVGKEFHDKGFNFSSVAVRNRLMVLRLIAQNGPMSRTSLAERLALTKTTLGNIVAELIETGLLQEITESNNTVSPALGRVPILLKISDHSPCICGIQINRNHFAAVVADLSGQIFAEETVSLCGLSDLTKEHILEMVVTLYDNVCKKTGRVIYAIGVSSIGPVDERTNSIVNAPNFFGIKQFNLCDLLQEKTGLPCYIIHDTNAGALAEKMYGGEQLTQNFIYLHIQNGIGCGYILGDQLYHGDIGQSGELGHSTINCDGKVCSCGNVGCLELYANLNNMNLKIQQMRKQFGIHSQFFQENRQYSLEEILEGAQNQDIYAIAALDEFCKYLSFAVLNTIKSLDINNIVIGYSGGKSPYILEKALKNMICQHITFQLGDELHIRHSVFDGNAPLYGAVALIADMVFEGKLNWLKSQKA